MTNFSLWNVLIARVQKRSVADGNFRAASYCEHGTKALKAHITAKSSSGGKGLFVRMMTKRGKPIADIQHNGKRVRVGFALRYDVVVDDQAALSAVFAEEITRWLTNAMREEPVKPPTTRPCSILSLSRRPKCWLRISPVPNSGGRQRLAFVSAVSRFPR